MGSRREETANHKPRRDRPKRGRDFRNRNGEAVPSGRTPRAGRILPASSALASGTLVALACICIGGSEHERAGPPRALRKDHAASPFVDSLHRFFGDVYRQMHTGPKTLLTSHQLDAYARDGFLVVSGLLDGDELSGLVDAGESLISKHVEKSGG